MPFGLVELITLLMSLSSFSLQSNPKAASPDAALHYAVPEADVVLHVDLASFVPNNYKILSGLANQPHIKSSPELFKAVRQVVTEVESMRGMSSSMVGIDPTTDLTDATMFVQIIPKQDPVFVASVRGKLNATSIDRIGKLTGAKPTKIGGGTMIELGGDKPALAVTKDGVLLAGTPKLIRDRLADTWRAPLTLNVPPAG